MYRYSKKFENSVDYPVNRRVYNSKHSKQIRIIAKGGIIMKKLIGLTLASALLLAACGDDDAVTNSSGEKLEETTVILDWTPNTNHTGLYVALENGYFEEAGLDVEIIQPADGTSATLVAAGKGDFGVSYQEDVTYALTNEEPLPITAVSTIIQHNTSGFAAPTANGISGVEDFEGKIYGGWGSASEEAIINSVMTDAGVDFNKLEIANIGSDDFFAATEKNVDLAWVFEGWTGIEAKLRGTDLNYFAVADLNPVFDYYTPLLISNNELIESNPEKVESFLEAATKGYEYAIEHSDEAADILLKYAPELDEELVHESQKFLANEYTADATQWGVMKEEVWSNYAKFLYDNALIPKELDTSKAYTNEFLPKK